MSIKENICDWTLKIKSRDFICPCGKSYLSYPALFTHIKQKHNGKAPGDIQRPQKQSRSYKDFSRHQAWQKIKKSQENSHQGNQKIQSSKFIQRTYQQQFNYLFTLLTNINQIEIQGAGLWVTLESFQNFQKFIDQPAWLRSYNCLGNNLSQFFKIVSLNTSAESFEQVVILFMSLLQYISEQNPYKNILKQCLIDILIQYINPFISHYAEKFSEKHKLKEMWIMKKHNIHKVFLCFYNWLKWKNYTNFCITLIE